MTRYIEAFHWTGTIQDFLHREVPERPLLNVCAGTSNWGDLRVDRWNVQTEQMRIFEPALVRADWQALPFASDSFAAVFADPPWEAGYKREVAGFMLEALRIAPVAYLMAPWIYGGASCILSRTWIRQIPGVNQAIVLSRYQRKPARNLERGDAESPVQADLRDKTSPHSPVERLPRRRTP